MSFHKGKIVYAFKIYMYSVQKLNAWNFYYFYTYIFILYYIFPVWMAVLDGNFALGCGPGKDYP
jgi:hypothetical protein